MINRLLEEYCETCYKYVAEYGHSKRIDHFLLEKRESGIEIIPQARIVLEKLLYDRGWKRVHRHNAAYFVCDLDDKFRISLIIAKWKGRDLFSPNL